MHRLEELRRWQRLQEERLYQEQMLQRKQLADEQSKLYYSYNTPQSSHGEDISIHDDLQQEDGSKSVENLVRLSEEMEGVSVLDISSESVPPTAPRGEFDNVETLPKLPESTISKIRGEFKTKSKIVLEEIPILPTAKDFKTLLEDKIKNNDAGIIVQKKKINVGPKPAPPKPRTFLKRGQGMVRFNLTPGDIGLTRTRRGAGAKPQRTLQHVSPLRQPDSKVLSKFQINNEISAKSEKISDCKSNIVHQSPDYSHEVGLSKKEPNNSPINGIRSLLSPEESKRTWGSLLQEEQERFRRLLRSPDREVSQSSAGPPHDWSDYSRSTPLDKIKSFKESAEQNLFDLLEKKVDNSSFCSTSSFIARATGVTGTDTPMASRDYLHTFPHVLSLKPGLTDIQTMDNLDSSRDSFVLNTDDSCGKPPDDTDPASSGNDEYSESTDTDQEQSSRKSSLSRQAGLSTSTPNRTQVAQNSSNKNNLRGKLLKIMICQDSNASDFKILQDEKNPSAGETTLIQSELTDSSSVSVDMKCNKIRDLDLEAKAELLKARLRELQQEINIFKNENDSLAQMQSELVLEKEKFFKEKAEAERKLNEDKIVSEYYLAEEKEKLAKQKLLYNRHVKDMKGNSAKKEREEIALLKKELNDLKENAKLRDSKVGLTQSRLRNQIKVLEDQNSQLKLETDKLKKDNNRLRSANIRSQRLSNINSLAEINKSLAQFSLHHKLTDVDVEEVFPERKEEKIPNTRKSCTVSKPMVIKHKVPMQRSKSVPNLAPTSRYAKFFSERDQECRQQKDQREYGQYCDSSEDSDNSILPDTHMCSSHPHSTPQLRDILEEKKSDSISKRSSLKPSSNNDCNKDGIIEQMYAEKFECGSNSGNQPRIAEPSEARKKPLQDNSTDHVVIDRADGSKEIRFTNGNTKIVSADESYSKFVYYNGDIKETFYNEGTIKYYYKEVNTHHTTYKDGSQVLQFPE